MRNYFYLFIFLMAAAHSEAQTPTANSALYAKRLTTNFHTNLGDYSPLDMDHYRGGFELAYGKNISRLANVVFPFKTTVFNRHGESKNDRYFSIGGRLQLHHNLEGTFSPYLLAGAGVIILPGETSAAQIPLGIGINIRANQYIGINLQTEFRKSFDDDLDHYQHGIGMYFNFGPMLPEPIVEEIPELPAPDRDMDGTVDSMDFCPDIPGLAAFGGCPDSDNDGISDQVDACPDLAGTKEFNGCPDTDGDGFSDLVDECPDVAGKLNGCPEKDTDFDGFLDSEDECPTIKGTLLGCPDRDKDGTPDTKDLCPDLAGPVNTNGCPDSDDDGLDDSKDKCPNKAGTLRNDGCPEISVEDKATLEFAMQAVNFQTGSAQLTLSSYSVLDQIKNILIKYPDHALSIEGHTDDIGEEENNLKLSQARAESCRNYLQSKGIAANRLSAIGYGESQPRVANDTPEGRTANRRVEFQMRMK